MNERPAWLRRIRADRERGATELARLAAEGPLTRADVSRRLRAMPIARGWG